MCSKKIPLLLFFSLLLVLQVSAHSGRTDSEGGHNSPTGYHYHHGYPPHQHPNNVCPYGYDDRTGETSGGESSSVSASIAAMTAKADYDNGYAAGKEAGYASGKKEGSEEGHKAGYEEGEKEGYDRGHSGGYADGRNAGLAAGRQDGYAKNQATLEATHVGYVSAIVILCIAFLLWHRHTSDKKQAVYEQCIAQSQTQLSELKGRFSVLQSDYTDICVDNERYQALSVANAQLQADLSSLSAQYRNMENMRHVHIQKCKEQELQFNTLRAVHMELLASYVDVCDERDQLRAHDPDKPCITSPVPLPVTPPIVKLITFGHWLPTVHQISDQYERYERAKLLVAPCVATIKGTKGIVYNVTLDTCSCQDFVRRGKQAPCKHIYSLALQLGFPLEEIFKFPPE